MIVKEVRFPLITDSRTRLKLYPHQVALWDEWTNERALLLASKTGTGKTRAVMLPLLEERQSGLAVYPTNELLGDQVRAVVNLATAVGQRAAIWTPSTASAELHSTSDVLLVPIDGRILTSWQKHFSCRSRGETLRRLLNPDQRKIIFINPDILFLILSLTYHAEPFEALLTYKTLILDEFHLYQGVELAHALAMVALARGFGFFRRVVLLSATPQRDVLHLLEDALGIQTISSSFEVPEASSEMHTAVHSVEVTPVLQGVQGNITAIRSSFQNRTSQLQLLRQEYPQDDYIPAVAVVNSVFSAIQLEDSLVESGFHRNDLSIIRGLSNRAIRDRRRKLAAIGTSAIEVGVDFDADYLLFEALDAGSFLQRFGRIGRHRPGHATVWVQPNVLDGMNSHADTHIERGEFERLIYSWYPAASSSPWFVRTENGMTTARAVAENLYMTVKRNGADESTLKKIHSRIAEIMSEHGRRLGCVTQETQASRLFARAASGKESCQWLQSYCRLSRFRTSLPSLEVHDFVEQSRRAEWTLGDYDIDLLSLLKRGRDIKWNDKLNKLTISGIGSVQTVSLTEIFSDNDCELILETERFPMLAVLQDGNVTPVSDIFGKRNHIFCVVRRSKVADLIDWRLPLIESGPYVVAFDGAALFLQELCRRPNSAKT